MTGEAPEGLRGAARSGGRWWAVSSLVQQGASVVATIVLARQLTPAQFGLAALAQTVVYFLSSFAEAGFGTGLVVRRSVDQRVVSTIFWSATLLGLLAAGVGVGLAVPAAAVLKSPEVAPYIAVGSLSLITAMAQSVVRGLLSRRLEFRRIAVADVLGVVSYLAVQVVLVLTTDLGAWVVVIGWLTMSAVTLVSMMVLGRWVPSLGFDTPTMREDLAFNAGFLGSTLVAYGAKNLDNWSVGRWMGTRAVGTYYVAFVLPNILRQRITWAGNQVLLPVLSRVEGREALGEVYLKVVRFVTFLAFPMLFGLAVVTEPLIELFFGPQWGAAVTPMRVFAVSAALDSVIALIVPLILNSGRSTLLVRTGVVRLTVLAGAIAVVVVLGPTLVGFSIAVGVATAAAAVVSFATLQGLTGLLPRHVLVAVVPSGIATLCMAAVATFVLRAMDDAAPVAQLAATVGAGGVAYVVAGLVFSRRSFQAAIGELVALVSGR